MKASACNWGGLSCVTPEDSTSVAMALEALSITAVARALVAFQERC